MEYRSLTSQERQRQQIEDKNALILNAWSVQNIVFELVSRNFLLNTPQSMGFSFGQNFSFDPAKSDILVQLAYTWKANEVGKRPAIFIERGSQEFKVRTIGGAVGINTKDSQTSYGVEAAMPITVKCIATNLGFCEMIAEYVKQSLLYYQFHIQQDFGFSRFRVAQVSKPEIFVESKEHFVILIGIETVFQEGCVIERDDLRLKTVSTTIFDGVVNTPLPNQ